MVGSEGPTLIFYAAPHLHCCWCVPGTPSSRCHLDVGRGRRRRIWVLDRILDNPQRDYAADALWQAKASFEARARVFARPANPRPFPPLAPLAGTFVNPSFG